MKKYDLIVVGGGLAGVSAAIAAGRSGAEVLLVEKGNCLGGAAVHSLVNPFMPNKVKIDGVTEHIYRGIFDEIVKKLEARFAIIGKNSMPFLEEELKYILNEMMKIL